MLRKIKLKMRKSLIKSFFFSLKKDDKSKGEQVMRPSSICLHRGKIRLLLTNRAKVGHQFPRNKNIFYRFKDTYWLEIVGR